MIFDHVRNLGICALVAAAAYWKFNNIGPETVIAAFDRVIAGWLLALAAWLYFVNTAHLRKRMASAGADKMVIEFVGALHTYLALTIVISAILARA